jgi:hypothetical protein
VRRGDSLDHPSLPADDYGLIEAYCNDENCDCLSLRSMLELLQRNTRCFGLNDSECALRWRITFTCSICETVSVLRMRGH